jgi:hypothetical protein
MGNTLYSKCCCAGKTESEVVFETPRGNQEQEVPSLKSHATLGVIRLDYDYPPSPGDIDCPASFGYDVFYRVVPGLTFEMCQSGKLAPDVRMKFLEAIGWMVAKGVSGITGDCGFMMYFQKLARTATKKPVFMSSLAQLPAITCAFSKDELIAVLTANGESLKPMRDLIKDECGVDPEDKRFVFVGCEDVPGFEAVALGQKVDVEAVTPGMVAKAKRTLEEHPEVRAFLFECTELPPYSDAVRAATGLPVMTRSLAAIILSEVSETTSFSAETIGKKIGTVCRQITTLAKTFPKRTRISLSTK